MKLLKIWTLKRGKVWPFEELCHLQQGLADAAEREIQAERDQPLSPRQWAQEEGSRYSRKRDPQIERMIDLEHRLGRIQGRGKR